MNDGWTFQKQQGSVHTFGISLWEVCENTAVGPRWFNQVTRQKGNGPYQIIPWGDISKTTVRVY